MQSTSVLLTDAILKATGGSKSSFKFITDSNHLVKPESTLSKKVSAGGQKIGTSQPKMKKLEPSMTNVSGVTYDFMRFTEIAKSSKQQTRRLPFT